MNDVWLAHHGILGQKWGKRQGPPYPLHPSNHSKSERKEGWKKSLDGDNSVLYNRKKISKETLAKNIREESKHNNRESASREKIQNRDRESKSSKEDKDPEASARRKAIAKKVAIGAAVVGGTILVAYGAKKLNDQAVEGLTKSYKYAAQQALQMANDQRRSSGSYGNSSALKKGMESARQVSKEFREKASSKDYSLREKLDYHLQKSKVKGSAKKLDYNNVYGMSKMANKYNERLSSKKRTSVMDISNAYKAAAKEAARTANQLEKQDATQNKKSIETYRQIAKEYQNKIKNNDYSLKDRADHQLKRLKVQGASKNIDYNSVYGLSKMNEDWLKKLTPTSSAAESERYKRLKAARQALGKLRSKK